jgi:cardiolipin synthase C
MHNKSFTADNQATIIGGRNIGDEYFGASEGVWFEDLDVLAIGSVVQDVSNDFDRYWASESSYPAECMLSPVDPGAVEDLVSAAARITQDPAAAGYIQALRDAKLIQELLRGSLDLEWATVHMISDDPAKGLGEVAPEALMAHWLARGIGESVSELQLVSPYFVPTAMGTKALAALAKRGVAIEILTNSLAATDVAAVHAGYAKRRQALLEAGITLYEMRRFAPQPERHKSAGPFRSSASSLHAKTFAVDGSRVFVGSFNFDPRSVNLNTELGFVIESTALAQQINAAFDTAIPAHAYQVRLSAAGDVYWLECQGGELRRHDTEPQTRFWQRAWVAFLSILPIEWLL